MSTVDATVVHAYCAVPTDARLTIEEGIDGSPLKVVRIGSIAVVTSPLDEARFGPAAWREHATDVAWLQQVAAEHHRVLEAAVSDADVLPLRLPAIHADLHTLRQVLGDQEEQLAQALLRVRGQVEMGAKVYVSGAPATETPASEATSGRTYLARRMSEATERERRRERQRVTVADAHEMLAANASRTTLGPPQDPVISGRSEPMVLNAAYLVHRSDLAVFRSSAEALRDQLVGEGLLLEITGPWPPYNFASLSGGEEPVQ
jgi:hypothetical protein